MSRLSDGRRLVLLLGTVGVLFLPGELAAARREAAQVDPAILHNAIECWPRDQFLILRAAFQPGLEVMAAKVYFRSDKYLDFYYVQLEVDPNGGGQAVMPRPSAETERIIYYLEMITRAYSSARSSEWDPRVIESGECRRRDPLAAWFTGDSPNIAVGATRLGATAIPPGFEAAGITGFINAAGVASGAAAGGLGAAPLIAAVGAAGATAGLVAANQGGGATTTTSVAAATTSSTTTSTPAPTTVPFNPAPLACFTTTPHPPIILEGQAVRFDASCSRGDALRADTIIYYKWDFGNGKLVEGEDRRVVSTQYTERGIYDVRLTVRDQGGLEASTRGGVTVQAPPPPTTTSTTSTTTTSIGLMADLVVKKRDNLDPVDVGDDRFEYEVTVTNLGPNVATGIKLEDTLPASLKVNAIIGPCNLVGVLLTCDFPSLNVDETASVTIRAVATVAGKITNVATVKANETDPDLKNNSVSEDTVVRDPVIPLRSVPLDSAFSSFLGIGPFDGNARGEVRVNDGFSASTDSSAPFRHRLSAKPGDNRVVAYLAADASEGGYWRFDFSGAAHFVAGSIQVEEGQVLAVDSYTVVFAVSGRAGERVSFRYRLQP